MAAVTLPPTALQTLPLTQPQAPQEPQPPNYLQRCVDELEPDMASAHETNATLWDIAAKATLVAFVILAVGAFVATGIFAPIYLPVVAVVAFCLLQPAFQLYQKFASYSLETEKRAEQLREITLEHNALPDNARLIGMKLAEMQIAWNTLPGMRQIDDVNQLKPLIARHEYWSKQQGRFEAEANRLITATNELQTAAAAAPAAPTDSDAPSLRERVLTNRENAFNAQESALISKVNTAFIHAVIQRPQFAGALNDIADFDETSFTVRALSRHFNDPAADHFVLFKNRNLQPILRSELSNPEVTVQAL